MNNTEEAPTKKTFGKLRMPSISLVGALAIAIVVALVIVAGAYYLYWVNPNRKYDIARAGSRDNNQILTIEDDEADTTSAVDPPAVKRKSEYLSKEINALSTMSDFNADDVSDQNLQLAQPEQPSL